MPVIPQSLQLAITLGQASFCHDTIGITLPAGIEVEMNWGPSDKRVYIVFSMTFGTYKLGAYQADGSYVGWEFWHSHPTQMALHFDPLVKSLDRVEYPHWLVCTSRDMVYLRIKNGFDTTETLDVTIWYIVCTKDQYLQLLDLLKGEAALYLNELKKYEVKR